MKKIITSVLIVLYCTSHVFEIVLAFLLGSHWADWNQKFVCEYL